MSNVIRFLEKMGGEAQWGSVIKEKVEWALADAEVEDSLRSAILDKDVAQLQALLQQKPLVGYVQAPGAPDEEEEEEENEEEPSEKDAQRSLSHLLASTA
ncbi:hypothetical protein [Dyella sp.]|jgi:CO dehydrogenase/acetyl-CoA synthase beta subunit|uniref:hypothetical protein n=1 Tax=Dyella sp. TaxID=1869338 RepID=UPI002FDAACED